MKHSSWLTLILAFALAFAASGSIQATAPPPPQSAVQEALSALRQVAGDSLNVEWSNGVSSVPTFVLGRIPAGQAAPEQAARQFFAQYGALYAMRDQAQELTLARIDRDDLDMQHVHFDQTVNGVLVFGGQMIVHLRGDEITAVNGKYFPNVSVDTSPHLTQAKALAGVLADIGDVQAEFRADRSGLVVYVDEAQQPHLAWKINAFSEKNLGNWLYFVDADSGKVIHKLNQLDTAKNLTVYNANHLSSLPGTLVCSNAACTSASDLDVRSAYTNTSKVYDYYLNVHGRDSYNGAGAELRSSVHYRTDYHNAFWNGAQMTYGDGDTYAQAFDVVAHELTHGVTEYTDNLIYEHQSGALNESWSDVMAVFAGCSAATGNADCNWLMGDTLAGGIIRDVSDPPAYGDPDHWSDYSWLPLEADNGGVHSNSGIPNKAAYLLTSGGTFHSVAVTGIGYTKTEQIYYRAMQHYLTTYSDFLSTRFSLYAACQDKIGTYGITSADCDQVLNAWTAVGVGSLPTTPGPIKVYLPIVMRPVPTCSPSGILNNGNFESGSAYWVQSSSGGYPIVTQQYPRDGSWSAWLGGYSYANDILYQTINIPAGRTALQVTYYLYISSQDSTTTPYDFLYTSLQPVSGVTLPETWVWDNTGRGGWWKITLTWNELPYAGQPMRLYFHATTNSTDFTAFFVDTASVQVQCSRYTALTAMSDSPVTIQRERVDGPPSLGLNNGFSR